VDAANRPKLLARLLTEDGPARVAARAMPDARAVFHMAAQTAVTTSMADPGDDFEVNARGILNLLEAARAQDPQLPVVFASTNKVYGRAGAPRFPGSRASPTCGSGWRAIASPSRKEHWHERSLDQSLLDL